MPPFHICTGDGLAPSDLTVSAREPYLCSTRPRLTCIHRQDLLHVQVHLDPELAPAQDLRPHAVQQRFARGKGLLDAAPATEPLRDLWRWRKIMMRIAYTGWWLFARDTEETIGINSDNIRP